MRLFEKDLAVDMGTEHTLLFEQGKGIVAREPTVVTVDKLTGKIQKIGDEAHKMLGRTPANIALIHPVNAGVISDYELAAQMLKELINRVTSFSLVKPSLLVCVPSSITGVEERAVLDAAIEAGARKVYLVESTIATALGAGVDISKPDGHLIIDIGGGTTEIAMISAGGVVECESIKVAGRAFDEAIVRFMKKKYGIQIGQGTAEELKKNIGCLIQRPEISTAQVHGSSLNGLPKTAEISSNELIEAFVEPMNLILDSIHTVLDRTAPQLVGDLQKNGIIMSGGGSLLFGIDRLIERSTGIHTVVVEDAISCAAYGAGKMLSHLAEMQDGMMNFYRLRQLRG